MTMDTIQATDEVALQQQRNVVIIFCASIILPSKAGVLEFDTMFSVQCILSTEFLNTLK
jgi:hypothetical protein